MKNITSACVLALSVLAFTASAEQMTGYISGSHCGAKHHSVSEANTMCVEKCLKGGAEPVLVVGTDKVVTIASDSTDKARPFAGKEVTVDGTMSGDTLTISSISAAK